MTMNFHWKRIAGIDQHALEPNMPPSNSFGSFGNTDFLRTHGTSPRSSLNLADDTKVPVGATLTKSGGHRGETAAPISAASFGDRGTGVTAHPANASNAITFR